MMAFLMIVCSSFIYIGSCAREYAFYTDDGGNAVPVVGTDNWDNSFVSTKCEEKGMRAARIETAEDQTAANELCKTKGTNVPCWFGLGRNQGDVKWYWQENGEDGEEIGSYTYWDTITGGQGCAGIWNEGSGDYGYEWHDIPCDWSTNHVEDIYLLCEIITACEALEIDGFLDHCSDNYASMLADINTKAAQSTLDDEIATINTALNTKADQTALDGAVTTINGEITTINTALATKADKSELTDEVNTINTALDTKADKTELSDEVATINAALDTKADTSTLDDAVATINTALDTKADTTALNDDVTTINGEITTINGQIEVINEHLALLKGSGFGAQIVGGELIDDGKATSWIDSNIFLLISLCTNVILVILAFYIAVNKSRNDGKYHKVSSYVDSSDAEPFRLNA